ncbi:hypothetical protein [Dysgonomonas sp. ZJ279]|uniref:hypothetical protein n=1 Tax=Dysgonomonas sp. ZJ279 TaxID=2709796 RepID=UPI0013EB81B7|nr:hypothetical protein [Dysgonomonas sp. ZJ279]
MNEIIVPHTKKKELRETFNTSHVTVRKALKGKSKSVLAKQIRERALHTNIGGYEITLIESESATPNR